MGHAVPSSPPPSASPPAEPSAPRPGEPMTAPAPGITITTMSNQHASAVLSIYQHGIATGHATFETTPPTWEQFTSSRLPNHRWVALSPTNQVLGWVTCSAVSDRCVYAGVVEHSLYVHPDARGQGIGRLLLDALIASTEQAGVWTIQAGVFPENTASLALHAACGFRVVGTRERLSRHHGVWRDVILIERRSPVVV